MKNFQKNKLNKKYQGFSLLEVMISMFIFVLTIVTAVSIFSSVNSSREKNRDIQRNIEDARTALELMAKNMRMSIELKNNGDQEIYMFNASQGICVDYKFDGGKLKIGQANQVTEGDYICTPGHASYGNYQDIIGNDVSGKFIIDSTLTSPPTIGKATIVLKVDGVDLQTSVSFRDYDNIVQ